MDGGNKIGLKRNNIGENVDISVKNILQVSSFRCV
jgi:hypothetical protein